MFRSTRALFAKEFSQHRQPLLALTAFLALIWLAAWAVFLRETRSFSVLEVVPGMARAALPAAALVLGHRLVVNEYYGRTQRFLEALPLRRGEEAAVKAIFGYAWLLLWALLSLLAAGFLASRQEPLGARFIALMAGRLAGYLLVVWAVSFLFSAFGRLRLPLLALSIAAVAMLIRRTEFDGASFGPLALIDSATFMVERVHMPWRALVSSLLIAAASFAAALALITMREGSVIEMLAKPVSTREKGAFLVVAFGSMIAASVVDARRSTPLSKRGTDLTLIASGSLEVVYFSEDLRPAAQRLVELLAPQLQQLANVVPAPQGLLRVVHGQDVLLDTAELAARHAGSSIVRVNLNAFAYAGLASAVSDRRTTLRALAEIIHAALVAASDGRALLEPKHWLLDGFSLYLAAQALPADAHFIEEGALIARKSAGQTPSVATLAAYHTLAEQVGEPQTMALAASGWRRLAQQAGEDRVWALAKKAFSRPARHDIRDFLHERIHTMPRLFAATTGLPWPDFVAGWDQWLSALARQPAFAEKLAQMPAAAIEVLGQNASALDSVIVKGRFATPLPEGASCEILHKLEGPFDTWPSPDLLQSDSLDLDKARLGFAQAIDGDYESGERVFVAVECRLPEVLGSARLHVQRVNVP